jgi:predicted nucleotidyltransferase
MPKKTQNDKKIVGKNPAEKEKNPERENKGKIAKPKAQKVAAPKPAAKAKKPLSPKQKEAVKKKIFEKAETFKKEILKRYKDLIKTVFVFGSYLRNDFTAESDLDVLILLDDTKMLITPEFKNKITQDAYQIAKNTDPLLHVQPAWTVTEFWDMVRLSHPLLHTVLRDGWALYDEGFFIPMKKLLERGKIPASLEAIELLMASAPQKIERARSVKLYQISEDCYGAMLNSSQAVLMYLGKPVPDPKNTPQAVKDYLVDTKLLPLKYFKMLQDVIKLRKDIEHKHVKDIRGAEVDLWMKKAEDYSNKMRSIYQGLQNQKKMAIIDRNYEILLKSTIYTLKKMEKLPPDPKNLPMAIKNHLINKNYLPKSYLETFNKVVGMKKAAEEDLSKITERDVELTRSYVKKFVDILDQMAKMEGASAAQAPPIPIPKKPASRKAKK